MHPLHEGMSQDSGDSVMTHELISRGTGVTNQNNTKNRVKKGRKLPKLAGYILIQQDFLRKIPHNYIIAKQLRVEN